MTPHTFLEQRTVKNHQASEGITRYLICNLKQITVRSKLTSLSHDKRCFFGQIPSFSGALVKFIIYDHFSICTLVGFEYNS